MLFPKRRWKVVDIDDAEELASRLSEVTWTLCTGFRHRGLLFLNDSTSEDGAQEYCILRETDMVQVETITFGWCSPKRALHHIRTLVEGPSETFGQYPVVIETPEEHGRCSRCA